MKKILLIAFREFVQKIKNKTFLLTTLLLPVGIAIFYGSIFYFTANDFETYKIAVIDTSKNIYQELENDEQFIFKSISNDVFERTDSFFSKNNYNAVLLIPDSQKEVEVIYANKIGLITKSDLEKKVQNAIEMHRWVQANVSKTLIDSLKQNVVFKYENVNGKNENELKEGISYGLGFGLGLLMYVVLTIYGSQVMRGVMEEKTNRIAEIIISSVKPIELMMGKIIGIGLVCLLQFFVWGVLIAILMFGVIFVSGDALQTLANSNSIPQNLQNTQELLRIVETLKEMPIFLIIAAFLFYFIGGYFLYSSLFASVGSAVNEDPQDVQSLMIPIMMPIFFSFVLLTKSINNPNCTEAIVGSLVPFTAPVVMMSRLVFGIPDGVPLWQLLLSMAILLSTTFLFTYLAARIYRIGILRYGKKANWKDFFNWIRINN